MELKKQFQQDKSLLRATDLSKNNSGLYAAARLRFGTYAKALQASGIDPREIRKDVDVFHWVKNLSEEEANNLDCRIKKFYSQGGNNESDSN